MTFTSVSDGDQATPAFMNARFQELDDGRYTVVNVKDSAYGATGDGSTDDLAAIQSAIDAAETAGGGIVLLPPGRYRTTDEIVLKSNVLVKGSGFAFWQTNPTDRPAIGEVTEIYYDGAGGTNSCVVRASTEAVGTKPVYTSPNTSTLTGGGITNLNIYGNNLAEFGLYSARAGLGVTYDRLVVSDTKKHGFWFGEFWTNKVSNLYAIWNYGRGITIGEDTFSWSGDNVVNAIHWDTIQTFRNGRDGTFDKSTALTDGCGVFFRGTRANVFTNLICELNDGAGLIVQTRSGPNIFNGIYVEDNDATTGLGIVVNGETGGGSQFIRLNGVYGAKNNQNIYLTGTEPSGAGNAGVVFDGAFGILGVEAEWDNYALKNCHSQMLTAITGSFPGMNRYVAKGTADLLNGTTSISANHGLPVTPTTRDVHVMPVETLGAASHYYLFEADATKITIRVDTDPGQDVLFVWKIDYTPLAATTPSA